jgi:hypothetical protein
MICKENCSLYVTNRIIKVRFEKHVAKKCKQNWPARWCLMSQQVQSGECRTCTWSVQLSRSRGTWAVVQLSWSAHVVQLSWSRAVSRQLWNFVCHKCENYYIFLRHLICHLQSPQTANWRVKCKRYFILVIICSNAPPKTLIVYVGAAILTHFSITFVSSLVRPHTVGLIECKKSKKIPPKNLKVKS